MGKLHSIAAVAIGVILSQASFANAEPALEELLVDASADEQTQWATWYQHGEGVSQDFDKSIRLYCAAAWEGNVEAQYQLGWMYANGRGVDQDDGVAAGWFSVAAAQGDRHAKTMLSHTGKSPTETPRCLTPGGEEVFQLPSGNTPEDQRLTTLLVRRIAPRYGLEPALVLALIKIESNFDPNARSPKDAQGLMQLIPPTATRFGVKDILHPLENLHGGMKYLRWLLEYFDGDVKLALAGYNAGEGAVTRYKGIPPYPETQRYVKLVMRLYAKATGA